MPVLPVATPPPPGLSLASFDYIASAMRLIGALASGENPSGSEAADGLAVLNQMCDSLSSERTIIFTVPRVIVNQNNVALSLVANQQVYRLGNAIGNEDFLLPRPPRLERVSVLYSASQSTPVEVPLEMLDDVGWQGIANKTATSLLPQTVNDDLGFPDRTLSFWPVPTQANPIALYPWIALSEFPDLVTRLTFPPGYPEFIRFNLAIRLFAEFSGDSTKFPLIEKLAQQAKARIQSINSPIKEAVCDEALVGGSGSQGNIYTGSPSRSHRY